MSKDLILQRKLIVEYWRVKATISTAKKRPEFMPVLKCLQEGINDVERIAEHLLFERNARLPVAHRLLGMLESYQLVERSGNSYGSKSRQFNLTEAGQRALDTKQIFIPEEGVWDIYFSNDPLLPYPMLSLQPHKETPASQEILGNESKKALEERSRNINKLPSWIKQINTEGESMPCLGGDVVRVDMIASQAEKLGEDLDLKIVWNIDQQSLSIIGNQQNKSNTHLNPPPSVLYGDVFQQLLVQNNLHQDWLEETGQLKVSYNNLSDTAKRQMKDSVEFTSANIPHYGHFDPLSRALNIQAKTPEDAQQWAEWRLLDQVNTFATEEVYSGWLKKATEPFNAFEHVSLIEPDEYPVSLPSRDEYSRRIWKSHPESKKAWYLAAATDWDL